MKTTLLTALVIFAGTWRTGDAYSAGAPVAACDGMTPGHYPVNPSSPQPPFTVTLSGNTYRPGSTVKVYISSPCGSTFRGFMLQARRADSDQNTTDAIGSFEPPTGAQVRTCGSGGQYVTHKDGSNDKTQMMFVWIAPGQAVGHIVFKATIVETISSFWTGVYSAAVLQEGLQTAVKPGPNVYPSPNSCPSTTNNTPSPTTKSNQIRSTTTATTQSLTKDPACGVTKGCASDCNGFRCSFLVKWNALPIGEDVRFEITAMLNHGQNQWMAIGLSDDWRMGNDSVVECVSYNGQTSVYSSYNHALTYRNSRLSDKYYGVRKISASVVNGVFSCTFDRQIAGASDRDLFGLTEHRYLLLASGRTESFSDEKMHHTDRPASTNTKVDFFYPMDINVGYMITAGQMKAMCVQPMVLIILAWIAKTVF